MSSISKELAELLVDNGLLSDADLELVEQEKDKTGEPLRIILERLHLATEKQLKNTLELQYGVNYLALHTISPELNVVDLLPADVIQEHGVVPIHLDGNRLTVAMVNPDSSPAMQAIKANVTMDIKPLVCFEDDFQIFLTQIEKIRHMPDRAVATVDDSEFGPETESEVAEMPTAGPSSEDEEHSGSSADDTADNSEQFRSEDDSQFEELPADEPISQVDQSHEQSDEHSETLQPDESNEHENVDAVEFNESADEYASEDHDADAVTSDTVTPSPQLMSGSYSVQYDTGSLDAIATPTASSGELDLIPTPNFDASELDSIPAPKAEASPPPEKPQPGGISALFRKDNAPKKAASDPTQERSGSLSALRGMMGGKKDKGGKKNEPAPPPPPPPQPPAPAPAPAAPTATAAQDSTAGGADEPPARVGLLSSKLGSAAHSSPAAKKFFKEKRTDSQPLPASEAKAEDAVPDWMNTIDENTPLDAGTSTEQTSETVQEYAEEPAAETDIDISAEQAVADYYKELGFDETQQPEMDNGLPSEESLTESEPTEETASAPAYDIPPMDPGAASFMSWTNDAAEEQAVSDALADASEALAASSAAVEEALADADDAWEEASAAADEAVAAGDMSSDSLPAYTEAQEEKPEGEFDQTQFEANVEASVESAETESEVQESESVKASEQDIATDETEQIAAQETLQEVASADELSQDEVPQTESEPEKETVLETVTEQVPDITGEENLDWGPEPTTEESTDDAAALLNEMADLADTLADDDTVDASVETADAPVELEQIPETVAEAPVDAPSDGFAETLDWGQESIDEAPAAAVDTPVQEMSAQETPVVEPAVAVSVEAEAAQSEAPVATPDDSAVQTAPSLEQTDEFNLDDSEFLSGVEELQAMAELSFSDGETAETDEFADIRDWGDEAPAVENLMSNLSTAAGEERPVEGAKDGAEAPPFLQEDLLQEMGLIKAEQIPAIRRECFTTGESLSAVLERMGIADEMELSDAFDMQFGAAYLSLGSVTIEAEVLNLLPAKIVQQRKVLPVTKTGNRVVVAMVNPDDLAAMNDIKFRLKGLEIKKAVCLEDDFEHFLRTHLVQSNGEPHFEVAPPALPLEVVPSNGAAPEESVSAAPPTVQPAIELPPVVAETAAPEPAATPEPTAVPGPETAPTQEPPAAPAAQTPVTETAPAPMPPVAAPPPAPAAPPVTQTPQIPIPAAPVQAPTPPPAAPAAPPAQPAMPPGIAALAKPPQPQIPAAAVPSVTPPASPQTPTPQPAASSLFPLVAPVTPPRPQLQPTLHEMPAHKAPGAPSASASPATPSASVAPAAPAPPVPPVGAPVLPAGVVPPKPISPQQIPNLPGQPRLNIPPGQSSAAPNPQAPATPSNPAAAVPTATPTAHQPVAPQTQPAQGQSAQPARVQPPGLVAPPPPPTPQQAVPPTPAPAPMPQPAVVQPIPQAIPTQPSIAPAPAPPAVPVPPTQPAPVQPTPQAPPQPAPVQPTPQAPTQPAPVQPTPQAPTQPAPVQPTPQVPPQPALVAPLSQTAPPQPPPAPPIQPVLQAPPSIPPQAVPQAPAAATAPPVMPATPAPGAAMPMPRINPNQIPGVRAAQQSGTNPALPSPAVPPQPVAPAAMQPQVPQVPPVPQAPPAPVAPPAVPTPVQPPAQATPAGTPEPPPLDPNLLSLARDIINKAADNGFSDVHIEPQATELELRYWYDGALIEATKLEKHIHGELIRCYKSIAGLSVEETKKPQDRRLKWTDTGAELDIRITTIPSEHGEMVAVSIKFDDEE